MAVPDRPDFDEVIDTVWGDWVHDEVARRGLVAYVEVTANQTGLAANTQYDLVGLIVTWTAIANRNYRVTMRGQAVPSAGSTCIIGVVEGPVAPAGGAPIINCAGYMANPGNGLDLVAERILRNVTPGSHTYKGVIMIVTGGGYFLAQPNQPGYIAIEDIGPVTP